MPPKILICDWNGTLIDIPNEKPVFESVAKDIFKFSIPFDIFRIIRIYTCRTKMKKLDKLWQKEKNHDLVREIFQIYNNNVVNGISYKNLVRFLDNFYGSDYVKQKLDFRLLNIIKNWHHMGKRAGIFSAACDYGIVKILKDTNYFHYFSFIQAEKLMCDGTKVCGFGIQMYGKKAGFLAKLLLDMNINTEDVAYIADTIDEEQCFNLVGYPILSLLATEETKSYFGKNPRVFIPENENDLYNYLNHK